jgi:trimethylguanosine synthase
MKDKNISPFGSDTQKYWDKRYLYFSKFDEGIEIDKEGLYSIVPEEVALAHAKSVKSKTIVDAFGGVGGSAISFARYLDKVYTIEIDKKRFEMIKNNAKVYGVSDKIVFINGDYFKEAPKIKAEAVFLDPPWGGPSYSKIDSFKLSNFSPDGKKILDLAFKHFKEIIIRVPLNFDFSELKQFNRMYIVKEDISDGRVISKTVYFT